jgi:uncharacterized cupredoxin-like copper-binding protein
MTRAIRLLTLTCGALLLAACAPDASNAAPVAVELADFRVILDPAEIPAGRLVFQTTNESSALVHEIEIFAATEAGAVLPVSESVADTTGLHLVDEIENIVPGGRASLVVDLAPGTYLVICNLPGHYGNGMWAYLTVTG